MLHSAIKTAIRERGTLWHDGDLETKRKIQVDYEGKLTFKERLLKKLQTSNTWIKVVVNIFRFILMLGVSYVILYPFLTKIAGSFMTVGDVIDYIEKKVS